MRNWLGFGLLGLRRGDRLGRRLFGGWGWKVRDLGSQNWRWVLLWWGFWRDRYFLLRFHIVISVDIDVFNFLAGFFTKQGRSLQVNVDSYII